MNAPPGAQPFDTRFLDVGDGHSLHVEQVGDPAGLPAVYLHGGPGSGCQPDQRGLFDPTRFRAVLFDQRGAGRSRPKRGLAANTTQHLIADMELIRARLGIARWLLVGGSWGALLAIAYARAHPDRVTGIVLRGTFLGSRAELDWALRRGPATFRPELWRAFQAPLPVAERADPVAAYGARLDDPDPRVHEPAARLWHGFEQALSALKPGRVALPSSFDEARRASGGVANSPFVEWHYLRRGFFLEDGVLLADAPRLAGCPGIIVQGRYDLLCPPVTARALARRWPGSELRIVEGAGHDLSEPGVRAAVRAAIEDVGRRISRP